MSLRTINLNLLPILRALLQEASVTRAAQALGLSQPATSAALSRLRAHLGDPLLIHVGKKMRLTPRAQSLMPQLVRVCDEIEGLLVETVFDPATTERLFTVAAPDYLALLLGARLLDTLKVTAPGVRLRFIDMPGQLPERLLAGDIDVSVCAVVADRWPQLGRTAGYLDLMVPVVRTDHPLARMACTSTQDFRPYPRLGFGGGLAYRLSAIPTGFANEVALAAEQFAILPLLTLQSDAFAIVPKSLADHLIGLYPLKILNTKDGDREINTGIFWSEVQESDQANIWFRDVLNKAMLAVFGPPV